jgi:hypothetical protein
MYTPQEGNPTVATETNKQKYPWSLTRVGAKERLTGLTRPQTRSVTRSMALDDGQSRVCSCGKVCKNEKGVKIHQSRMKCRTQSQTLRKGQPDKTVEEMGQEKHHSAQNLTGEDDVFEA